MIHSLYIGYQAEITSIAWIVCSSPFFRIFNWDKWVRGESFKSRKGCFHHTDLLKTCVVSKLHTNWRNIEHKMASYLQKCYKHIKIIVFFPFLLLTCIVYVIKYLNIPINLGLTTEYPTTIVNLSLHITFFKNMCASRIKYNTGEVIIPQQLWSALKHLLSFLKFSPVFQIPLLPFLYYRSVIASSEPPCLQRKKYYMYMYVYHTITLLWIPFTPYKVFTPSFLHHRSTCIPLTKIPSTSWKIIRI